MRRGMTEAWTKWRGLVSEQSESGQSVAAFCEERGLWAWQFYEWKKRLRESKAGGQDTALRHFGSEIVAAV
jgi:hypothetical protein